MSVAIETAEIYIHCPDDQDDNHDNGGNDVVTDTSERRSSWRHQVVDEPRQGERHHVTVHDDGTSLPRVAAQRRRQRR